MKLVSCRNKGQAMVEFAIVLPLIIMILLGIIYLGMIYHSVSAADTSAGNSAKEAALYINDGTNSCYLLAQIGRGHPVFLGMENVSFHVSNNCTEVVGDPASLPGSIITATWEFDFISRIPFVPVTHHFVITKEAFVH